MVRCSGLSCKVETSLYLGCIFEGTYAFIWHLFLIDVGLGQGQLVQPFMTAVSSAARLSHRQLSCRRWWRAATWLTTLVTEGTWWRWSARPSVAIHFWWNASWACWYRKAGAQLTVKATLLLPHWEGGGQAWMQDQHINSTARRAHPAPGWPIASASLVASADGDG